MSEQEIRNRINILKQQLEMVNIYREDFEKNHGKRETEKIINTMLDEYSLRKKQLENLLNKN